MAMFVAAVMDAFFVAINATWYVAFGRNPLNLFASSFCLLMFVVALTQL